MLRWFMLPVCALGWCIALQAQMQTLEAGLFAGISTYFGDLQQVRFEKDEAHPAWGGFLRYRPSPRWAFKGHFYKGQISGSDANYTGLNIRKRNLSFRSPVLEAGLQTELSLARFGERESFKASPYIFSGLSVFYFNPQAPFNGGWVALQPLGTEGQGLPQYPEPYKLVQVSIPLGVGFQFAVAQAVFFGFELGFRKTFTDYLDDISSTYPDLALLASHNPMAAELSFRSPEFTGQELPLPSGEVRGDPDTLDMYFFGGFTCSVVIQKWFKPKKRATVKNFRAQF
ncbi:MAG: DUF6089 family protein [Saprospiraceae bacterium]